MSIILIEVFASVFCLTLVFMEYFFIPLLENRRRLRDIGNYSKIHIKSGVDEELQVNFKERILDPLVAKMSSITQKYTPVKQKDTIEKNSKMLAGLLAGKLLILLQCKSLWRLRWPFWSTYFVRYYFIPA